MVNDLHQAAPIVVTETGAVRGQWREGSAAFYGIPFAAAPVGPRRFAAPAPVEPWAGVRDATEPGPTPQRRPFGPQTTIPEPSIPGESTLNVNVFTPAPGQSSAALPVLVWIHGGGFFAGSPSSPWYDGRSFNRDQVVTVSISYRLGFDGFGWIADAVTNRGLRDQLAALAWVQRNIAAFGGDPGRVTIAGQSAGGSSVMDLLVSPLSDGLFTQVIAHSAASIPLSLDDAERAGRALAAKLGVEPTIAGLSQCSEDAILDAQTAMMAGGAGPATAAEAAAASVSAGLNTLPFAPMVGDDVLPFGVEEALARGLDGQRALLIGTVAHEFTMVTAGARQAWADADAFEVLVGAGLPAEAAAAYVADQPELTTTADIVGQLGTDRTFRIFTLACADEHAGNSWVYDFRWTPPGLGLVFHCAELPFSWDVLDAEGVAAVLGPQPPAELAAQMHAAWVSFIESGDPGWPMWDGGNPHVFGAEQRNSYAAARVLSSALSAISEH